jgi:hypothetical protein
MLNLKEFSLPISVGVLLGLVLATYVGPETEEGYAVLILVPALVSYVIWRVGSLLLKGLRRSSWTGSRPTTPTEG